MVFTSMTELYFRDKIELGNKIMNDLNEVVGKVTPNLQQDLTDSIVDVFSLIEAIHYHIDVHLAIDKKIQQARIESAKVTKENADLKLQNAELNRKLADALEQSL